MRDHARLSRSRGFSLVEVLISVFLTGLLFWLFARLAAEVGLMARASEFRFSESQLLSTVERHFSDDARSALGFSIPSPDRLEISRIDLNGDRGLSLGFPESPPGAWSPYQSLETVVWSRQDNNLQRLSPSFGSSVLLEEVRNVTFSQQPDLLLLEVELSGAKAGRVLTLRGVTICLP